MNISSRKIVYPSFQLGLLVYLASTARYVTAVADANLGAGLPGIDLNQRTKFMLGRGERFCLYQYLRPGNDLSLEATVVSTTPNQKFGFYAESNDMVLFRFRVGHELKESRRIESYEAGDYAFCFENQASWTSVVIELSIQSVNMEQLHKYFGTLADVQQVAHNIPIKFVEVWKRIVYITMSVAHAKQHIVEDEQLAIANLNYVNRWSTFQCICIVLSGIAQVAIYRRMFNYQATTSGGKPRA